MTSVETLRHDHDVLRQALGQLQHSVMICHASHVTQEICRVLVRQLDAHLRREEAFLAPHANRIQAVLSEHQAPDHVEPRVVLQDLEAVFAKIEEVPTGVLVLRLCRLIDELRERLNEEEREIFPLMREPQAE